MTQQRLAMDAELDLSYLNDLELGKRNPSLGTMLKLRRALNCSLMELLQGLSPDD